VTTKPELRRAQGGPPDDKLLDEVAHLKSRGEHAAAAAALWSAGFPREAAEIYEQIFELESALGAYEKAGDVRGAMGVALKMDAHDAVERIIARATHEGAAESLLDMLERNSRHREIGQIHVALGDHEKAAAAFERGQHFAKAAESFEALGDLRSAGVCLEKHLEQDPNDPEASLMLGRVLARFSRHDDGITLLQRAVQGAAEPREMMCKAAPTMVLSFEALGYTAASRDVFARWQDAAEALDRQAPVSFEDFLQSDRAAAFAAVLSRRGGRPPTSPPSPASPASGGLDAFFGGGAQEPEAVEPDDASSAEDDRGEGALLLAGRYLLGEPLGGGGVGQVFRAYDAFTDTPVAVKIFASQAMASDAVKAYAREARAASSLGHAAIVPLVELNMPQGFVVNELVDAAEGGRGLEEALQSGGDSSWLLPMLHGVLDVLSTAHRVGLVHGALKPNNVFLIPGGVRVLDFGANHLLALRSTETGGLASAWPYLSPQQLFGGAANTSADLYAVAAMAYRALTGHPPFARAESDRRQAPEPASGSNPEAAAWDALLQRALSPDPEERFASADEMREALPSRVPAELPAARALAGETQQAPAILERSDRYTRGDLVFRDGRRARVYEGRDLTVERPVWIVEADDESVVHAMQICARLPEGVQPVYDVLPDAGRAVIARDPAQEPAELDDLREVPQSLARDLRAIAKALLFLHDEQLALAGFAAGRAMGPTGPRLRLAPAPIPVAATDDTRARDWASFRSFALEAFGADASSTEDPRRSLAGALGQARLLEAAAVAALAESAAEVEFSDADWPRFLERVVEHLVAGTRARVIARVAASVLAE
jgi:tetratricopeptide (TPR) repeat protein